MCIPELNEKRPQGLESFLTYHTSLPISTFLKCYESTWTETSQRQSSPATPQHPEAAQGDGVESQHNQVALKEQLVEALQEDQPPNVLLVHLVLGLEVVADGLQLGQDFLQGP